jgi:hypothetical protein
MKVGSQTKEMMLKTHWLSVYRYWQAVRENFLDVSMSSNRKLMIHGVGGGEGDNQNGYHAVELQLSGDA